jgi:hypothetical protein
MVRAIRREANAAEKARCSGARGLPEAITPRSISADGCVQVLAFLSQASFEPRNTGLQKFLNQGPYIGRVFSQQLPQVLPQLDYPEVDRRVRCFLSTCLLRASSARHPLGRSQQKEAVGFGHAGQQLGELP